MIVLTFMTNIMHKSGIRKKKSNLILSSYQHTVRCPYCLWIHLLSLLPLSMGTLSKWFIDLVLESRCFASMMVPVAVGPQQKHKCSASYSSIVGHDKEIIVHLMGHISIKILKFLLMVVLSLHEESMIYQPLSDF